MTRDEALHILNEWVPNKNLQKHMFAVEAAVKFYANKYGEDEKKWGLAGLLHDADWEKYPKEHPQMIVEELEKRGLDQEIINAIARHGGKGATPTETRLDKCLFACDELTGLIVATALMYPNKLEDVTVQRVVKKFKNPGFARGVNREEVVKGTEDFGISLEEHVGNVLEAMMGVRQELGL